MAEAMPRAGCSDLLCQWIEALSAATMNEMRWNTALTLTQNIGVSALNVVSLSLYRFRPVDAISIGFAVR